MCYKYLQSHEMIGEKWGYHYHFYFPSIDKYGHQQWLWDSCSHMIAWSHRNVNNSIADIRTMLQMQQPNGFIPEMIFWAPDTKEEEELRKLQWTSEKYTDIVCIHPIFLDFDTPLAFPSEVYVVPVRVCVCRRKCQSFHTLFVRYSTRHMM